MDQIELRVNEREVLGKKVRFLRRQGITPVHLFGHGIDSEALQCDTNALKRVLADAGHTGLINLKLDGKKKPRTVVTREIQRGLRPGEILHVDFYQVKMAEAVKVEIPVVLIGEAPALKLKENTLVHELTALIIECLPAKIPASIEIDLSPLTQANQTVRVKDIDLDDDINILSDPESVLVKITARQIGRLEEVKEAIEVEEEGVKAAETGVPTAEATETALTEEEELKEQ